MKTFNIVADVTISVYTEVEAETLEEAIEIAEDRNLMETLCDVGVNPEEEWVTTELNWLPENIREC